jgi:prepilin-type N-terminal cleavage/methylation domain-containing protein
MPRAPELLVTKKMKNVCSNDEKGFSLIELLIVMLVMTILSLMAYRAIGGVVLFEADNRAYAVMDILKEAKQRAITQQETLRVEINRDTNSIHLINENDAGDVSDDVEIKSYSLLGETTVVFDAAPTNQAAAPVEPTPVPALDFKASVYPTSLSEQVATLRFLRNGNVMDAGSNAVGDNAVMTGATIYFWMPKKLANGSDSDEGKIIRAITIMGNSGTPRYWKCPVDETSGGCAAWVK